MKTAAVVLGIVGAACGLVLFTVIGLLVGGMISLAGEASATPGAGRLATLITVLFIVVPLVALAGAILARSHSLAGGVMMLVAGLLPFPFLKVNLVTLMPGIPLVIAGVLSLLAARQVARGKPA
ncbi:MAG: hypothetical protein BWX88_03127 [Planctomycetes bacterium ADurb.Bin126]|nr:MAG: hypothetical protein BWX88_03127 [Planctomycetes bacterium ADurb.Bin126]HOD82270.1 hypothetical protein [Phycisphaerae bacterium]HQL72917.1 hypothetical protein [Phycisphaerae bacterium]